MKTPTVEIVTASKPLIAELRAMDTHNRKKKKGHIDYLRKQIREKRWTVTNQGIGVSVSGYIVDGGHRLEAIELEGCPPVQFILARNLPDVSQKYVDQHNRRGMADVLTLFFDTNVTSRAVAVTNMLLRTENGFRSSKHSPDEYINAMEKYGEAMRRVFEVTNISRLSAATVAAIILGYQETEDERVFQFCSQVISGEMLQAGDPALALRNFLNNLSVKGGGNVQSQIFLKTTNALNCFLDNKRLTRVHAKKIASQSQEQTPDNAYELAGQC